MHLSLKNMAVYKLGIWKNNQQLLISLLNEGEILTRNSKMSPEFIDDNKVNTTLATTTVVKTIIR